MEEFRLTTADNPYSPFDEFDKWYYFDEVERGYGTLEYLDRIKELYMTVFDDKDEDIAEQMAINEIVERNVLGIFVKVTQEQAKDIAKARNKKNNTNKTV